MNCNATASSTSFAYVVGEVSAVFSSRGARWEYETQRRALGGAPFAKVIAHAPFLARALTIVLEIEGREQYLLMPRCIHEMDELIGAARLREPGLEEAGARFRVAIVGTLLPFDAAGADPLPTVMVEAVHHWPKEAPPGPDGEEKLAEERLLRATHNAGLGEGDRALNFVVARSEELHTRVKELSSQGHRAIRVFHEPCRLAHPRRREVNVVLAWTEPDGKTNAESLRVDVSGLHPYPTDAAFMPYQMKLGGG